MPVLGLGLGETDVEGDTDALGLADALGLRLWLALGLRLWLALGELDADGLILAELDGELDADGLMLVDGLPVNRPKLPSVSALGFRT